MFLMTKYKLIFMSHLRRLLSIELLSSKIFEKMSLNNLPSSDFASSFKPVTICTKDGRFFIVWQQKVPILADFLNIFSQLSISYDKIAIAIPRMIDLIVIYSKNDIQNNVASNSNLPFPSIIVPLKQEDDFTSQIITDNLKIPLILYESNDGKYSLIKPFDPESLLSKYSDPLHCFESFKPIDLVETHPRVKSVIKLLDNSWNQPMNDSFYRLAKVACDSTLERYKKLKKEPLLKIISICPPKKEHIKVPLMISATIGFSLPGDIPITQMTFPTTSDVTADEALKQILDKMMKKFDIGSLPSYDEYCFLIPGTDEIIAGSYLLNNFIFIQKFIESTKTFLDLTILKRDSIKTIKHRKDESDEKLIQLPEYFDTSHTTKIYLPHFLISTKFSIFIEGIKFNSSIRGSFKIESILYVGSTLIESIKFYDSENIFIIDDFSSMGLKIDFNKCVNQLPRYSKLVIKIYMKTNKRNEIVGYASMPIFDHNGRIHTGRKLINFCLCKHLPPTPVSPIKSDCCVYLKLPEYSRPIFFELLDVRKPTIGQNEFSEQDINNMNFPSLITKPLTFEQQTFLYQYRWVLTSFPQLLILYLASINLCQIDVISELPLLLKEWQEPNISSILLLLSDKFTDPIIRNYAVSKLENWTDGELSLYLLQIVQSLQFEPHDDSNLALFLLKRAILEPKYLGLQFFWNLKSLFDLPWMHSRALWIMTALIAFSDNHESFVFSYSFTEMQLKICEKYVDENLNKVQELLTQQRLPPNTQLPIDPKLIVTEYVPKMCFFADSAKKPLFLTFKSADPFCTDYIRMMVKLNDDLRQDQITLQIMKVMDDIWKKHGLNMRLKLYSVLSTGANQGIIEIVPNAVTIASIQKKRGKISGVLKNDVISKWIYDAHPEEITDILENFTYSMAGYIVATYVLGIGDRHCSNMMIQKDGHFFHIDFGHFLGHFKTCLGMERESNLFYFSDAFAYVFGDVNGPLYHEFEKLCCYAFNIIRANHDIIFTLLYLMLDTGIPELESIDDLKYIENALMLNLTDDEASAKLCEMFKIIPKMKRTAVSDFCHLTQH
ncbi:Phosphatidylinositol 3- and 4-kinase family protein [Tritrichomonas foetus]|uniref:Phosphatidylinositol 3- and 4-kinase family protein n=1 Tax=Tritrichomonas foetus TaxID=1144522 RepID=A0A1J4KWA2_9EUKA|nr:Phosphatidylinositol 3- and 4-kinase family protein [Tritrichomonas foetus]|eukprot:OHT14028.1 Phosphatidylinositol 3- and 4-kinase family protein [Tritrichomonas foetus]